MNNKYLNEAIIGNKELLVTFSSKGELLRVYYPSRDNRQFIDFCHVGVKVNDSNLIYLHQDINNTYKQYYDTDTNILNTEITNTYFKLKIIQTDFVLLKENILVRKYELINDNNIDLNVNFLTHMELLTDYNNFVSAKITDGGMIQYAHDYTISTFVRNYKLLSHQINGSKETIGSGVIYDKDYVGMSNDSSVSYDLGTIKSGQKKVIELCMYFCETTNGIQKTENEIERIKRIDLQKEYSKTKSYWRKYVREHNGLCIKEPKNSYEEKMYNIYLRSILLFPLLTNHSTGGIIAAPEIDEDRNFCGRYVYCWPRDAVFITKALDILKMTKEVEKFYKVFCKITQSKNGMWEQRFYTDGKIAPCWGYQVDETASVVYGVWSHFEYTKDNKFLKDNLQMCERAIEFLKKYVKQNLEIEDFSGDVVKKEIENSSYAKKEKIHVSYDLWEMHEGIHLYSLASIYSAFDCIQKMYTILGKDISNFEGNRLKDEKIAKSVEELKKLQVEIKNFINSNLYDQTTSSYVRNMEDRKMDVSIIGSVIPFNVFTPNEKKIENTIEKINLTLRTYTGGYQRFEGDHYMNGNPWPIANLWMTLYYLEKGEKKKAKETFDFVIKTVGKHSLLGEQIDNGTLKPNWVLGLGWSHAMFIIVMEKMLDLY